MVTAFAILAIFFKSQVKTVLMSMTLSAIYSRNWQIFMAARCPDTSIADKEVGK